MIHKHWEVILLVIVALTETLNSFFVVARWLYMCICLDGNNDNKLYVKNSYTEYAIDITFKVIPLKINSNWIFLKVWTIVN